MLLLLLQQLSLYSSPKNDTDSSRGGEPESGDDLCPIPKVNSWKAARPQISSGPAWLRQQRNNWTRCLLLAYLRDLDPERGSGRKLNVQASNEELTGSAWR